MQDRFMKGPWRSQEDGRLCEIISYLQGAACDQRMRTESTWKAAKSLEGYEISWKHVSEMMTTRSSAQCRQRWVNYLDPRVCRKKWTLEEEQELICLFEKHGSKWAVIKEHSGSESAIRQRSVFDLRTKLRSILRTLFVPGTLILKNAAVEAFKGKENRRIIQEQGNGVKGFDVSQKRGDHMGALADSRKHSRTLSVNCGQLDNQARILGTKRAKGTDDVTIGSSRFRKVCAAKQDKPQPSVNRVKQHSREVREAVQGLLKLSQVVL